MSEENKSHLGFWALLAVVVGGGIFAATKIFAAKKSDTNPTPNPTPKPTPTTNSFDYKKYLNGKWSMTYTDGINKGTESGVITNGDTYTLDGGETRKITNISYDKVTKTLRFTEVGANNSAYPETIVVIDDVNNKMVGTNGGWQVVYQKSTSSTNTIPTPTTTQTGQTSNIVKYKEGYYNSSTKCFFDNNDNLIADGVDHYDSTTKTIFYTNGYNLNTLTGILLNDNGVRLLQNINSNKLPLKSVDGWNNKTYFPTPAKIYGYSSIDNIYFYIENDLTPYSLLDSYAYWVSVIFFGGGYQGTNVPLKIYTNARVYNAVQNPLQNQSKSSYLLSYQTQYTNKLPLLYTHNIRSTGDGFLMYDLFALNYPNVFYDTAGNFRGAGVIKIDKSKQIVYFEDSYFLDLKNNTLYDKSGQQVATNVNNYISTLAFNSGVGLVMNNIGSNRLPSGVSADAVAKTITSSLDQINFKSNFSSITTNSIF